MKRASINFILLVGIIFSLVLFLKPEKDIYASIPPQQETDSTYTTLSSTVTNGYAGSDTCHHEWFMTTTSENDTVAHTQTQTVSRQCTKCGRQTTTINIWKTYEKDTTGSY